MKNKIGVLAGMVLMLLLSHATAETTSGKKRPADALRKILPSPTSEPTPVAGVRGLEETSEKADTKLRDYAAIDRLNQLRITADSLQRFIKDGGLQ